MENIDSKTLQKLTDLEGRKAELVTKINSLNDIKASVSTNSIEKIISLNVAGIEDGSFNASVAELKALYAKRREMSQIYTPDSEPMREINRLINEAKYTSQSGLKKYFQGYNDKLIALDGDSGQIDQE